MFGLILGIHVFVAILLILAILLHQPQHGGMGFLSGGTTFFGARGAAPFLIKTIVTLAVIFGITSFSLAIMRHRSGAQTTIERAIRKGKVAPQLPMEPTLPRETPQGEEK